MQKSDTQTILVKAPFKGWVSPLAGTASAASPNASFEGKEGQYAYSNGISLFRLEKLGHIAPGHVFTAITDSGTRINELPLNAGMASNSKPFVLLKNSRVVRLSNDGTSTEANYDVTAHGGHTVASSSLNGDILVIKDLATTPVEYVLSTWEDDADADMKIMTIDGSTTVDDDWLSTVPSGAGVLKKGVPLKMCNGPDGDVVITNGSYLAHLDITGAIASSTLNRTRLSFGGGWVATGVCAWKNYYVIIGSQQATFGSATNITREITRVWFWDASASNFNFPIDIPDNYGNAIFSDGSKLFALTNGRNNSSKIWEFNGTDFGDIPMFETPFIGPTATPVQGNLEWYQNSLLIGSTSNGQSHLYRYISGTGFHDEAVLSDGTFEATSVGMVKNLFQAQLFAGVSYGSPSPVYKIFYQSNFTSYYVNADFRTKLYELGMNATITRIRVYFSQFGTGASVALSLYEGYDTLDAIGSGNDKLRKTLTNATLGSVKEVDITDFAIENISSFYMNIRFNHASSSNTAAIIERIEIDWKPSITI